MQTNNIAKTLSGIYRLLAIAFVLFLLYFAQSIVIPLTVAALLTFLLSPLATMMEKWVGRVASILITVLAAFSVIGLIGYLFAIQLIEFGSHFENYSQLIQTKFQAFQFSGKALFDKFDYAFENFKVGVFGPSTGPISSESSTPDVKLIDLGPRITSLIETLVGSLFSLFSMAGIILLLVIFMLLNREDIRSRIIKLMGQSRISSTTSAMKDASEKVTSYLFRLLVVNLGFGLWVFVGLMLIGIPNALLWGCLAGILRFIPYLGAWIAAIIPIALSFIISDGWLIPIVTITFFILLEIITAYVIEPYYYGEGTGVSSFALILAAIFWTWLWGPVGLLLSTPLTVCLVVLGQYVTNVNFLRVLLSKEQPLTATEEIYHHLLLKGSTESMEVIETYLQKNSLLSLHDEVLLPIIFQTEKDFHLDLIDAEKKGEVYQAFNEIIEFLDLNEPKAPIKETSEEEKPEEKVKPEEKEKPKEKVLCLPLRTLRDELGAAILAQTLSSEGYPVVREKKLGLTEMQALIDKEDPQTLCVVAAAPFVLSHARFLTSKIAQHTPQLPIVLCLLGSLELDPIAVEKLSASGVTKVVYTLSQALKTLQDLHAKE